MAFVCDDLVRFLLPVHAPLEPADAARIEEDTIAFVRSEIQDAAWPIRWGASLLGFGVACLIAIGKLAGAFAPSVNKSNSLALLACERLGGSSLRTYIRLIRSLTVLAYYDHPLVSQAMTAAARSQSRSFAETSDATSCPPPIGSHNRP